LLYATGGLALARISATNSFHDFENFPRGGAFDASGSSSDNAGWTVGSGAEPHWSVKAEYLYVNLGQVSTTGNVRIAAAPAASSALTSSFNLSTQIVRGRLNYKF
jgi:outer membrane immunogenic protein